MERLHCEECKAKQCQVEKSSESNLRVESSQISQMQCTVIERGEVRERIERRMKGIIYKRSKKKKSGITQEDREVRVREMDGERGYE